MPEKEIVVGSRNVGKLKEIQAVLAGLPVRLCSLADFPDAPEVEETGTTFRQNAELKATALADHLDRLVLADDSGLEVDTLDGAPGVFSARYAGKHGDDEANNRKLLEAIKDRPDSERAARFRCVIALAEPGRVLLTVEGECEGFVAFEPRGDEGFGYDPVFIYPPVGKTFGELDPAYKNQVSHRGAALSKLRQEFLSTLEGQP